MFIFFHLQVYTIENECFWKAKNLSSFYIDDLKIFLPIAHHPLGHAVTSEAHTPDA